MIIIQREPNPSGAYPAPQIWASHNIPDTHAIIPDGVDLTEFYDYNGFVELRIVGNTVVRITPNAVAWEEWKASLPEPEPEPPTQEERITLLEEQIAQADKEEFEKQKAEVELGKRQIHAHRVVAAAGYGENAEAVVDIVLGDTDNLEYKINFKMVELDWPLTICTSSKMQSHL